MFWQYQIALKKHIPLEKKKIDFYLFIYKKKLIITQYAFFEIIQIFVAVNNDKNQNNFSTLEI